MKFRINHGPAGSESAELMLVFEEEDIPDLRRLLDALEGKGGHKAHPAPYVPLYRKHGIDPATMYPTKDEADGVGREGR